MHKFVKIDINDDMWIERGNSKSHLISRLINLDRQVLIVQGARQVGKTSLILKALGELKDYPQVAINLLYPSSFRADGIEYFGRDFFGSTPEGVELIKNLESVLGPFSALSKPALVFVDEADRHPKALESIQTLAEFSKHIKCVFTGSNLENLPIDNAATGRKAYFDLYPITFFEFQKAAGEVRILKQLEELSLSNTVTPELAHNRASELYSTYLRLGGMPKLLSQFLNAPLDYQALSDEIRGLAVSIEENVKTILGEKAKMYEYEDVLRRLCRLSLNTLKFSHLQVQHAGRAEAKRLVYKTVGARAAHKIRLWGNDKDLSKYIIFDSGIANYLLCGSDLLRSNWGENESAIIYETAIGNALINKLNTRSDLLYWKSGNQAEVEYMLRSPKFVGIDVKTSSGPPRSLNSMALREPDLELLVRVSSNPLHYQPNYVARLATNTEVKKIPLLNLPHYLIDRLLKIIA